jgi:hypothetical protein
VPLAADQDVVEAELVDAEPPRAAATRKLEAPRPKPFKKKRKAAGGDNAVLIIGLVGGGVVALAVVAVLYVFVFRSREKAPPGEAPNAWVAQPNAPRGPMGQPPGNGPGQPQGNPPAQGNPPPANPAPQADPGAQPGAMEITLSNGRATTRGFKQAFLADYQFTGGGPRPGQFYFWIIKSASGRSYECQLHLVHLHNSGTMEADSFGIAAADHGPFETYVEVGDLIQTPLSRPRQRVSNTITMTVQQGGGPPFGPGANGQPPGMPGMPGMPQPPGGLPRPPFGRPGGRP